MSICARGLDTLAFLSWFRTGGAVCKRMANEYRNTGIDVLKKPSQLLKYFGLTDLL